MGGVHVVACAGGVEGHDSPAPALFHQQVDGEPPLHDRCCGGPHRVDQGPLDLRPSGRPAGVHHPGHGVPALPRQGQAAGGVEVEHRPQGDEVLHPARPLVDQDPDGVDVAQAGAGGQGVGQVEIGGIGVAAQDGGHPALGPPGGGLMEVGLGQHAHPDSGMGGRGLHSRREAGDPAAKDEQVQVRQEGRFDLGDGSAGRRARPSARTRPARRRHSRRR